MKLYHATHLNNKSSILENGIIPSISKKISFDKRLNKKVVYGFDNIEDAINFMVWDNNTEIHNVVVFSFDAANPIMDTEYESGAFAVEGEISVNLLKEELI